MDIATTTKETDNVSSVLQPCVGCVLCNGCPMTDTLFTERFSVFLHDILQRVVFKMAIVSFRKRESCHKNNMGFNSEFSITKKSAMLNAAYVFTVGVLAV